MKMSPTVAHGPNESRMSLGFRLSAAKCMG
jgi:hypothetical protein